MKQVEAMKQALEALENVLCDPDGNVCWHGSYADRDIIGDALAVFRAAIAEAELAAAQELVANVSAWFALVMNAAAELEDASHCLRDEDAKRVAIRGAKHYRDAAKALYTTPPAAPDVADIIAGELNVSRGAAYGMMRKALEAAQPAVPLTELVDYILQDDIQNRLTPRVVDIAYSAFVIAKQGKNKDDGGPCDWFNDTKPMVMEALAKIRKDLAEAAHGITAPAQKGGEA